MTKDEEKTVRAMKRVAKKADAALTLARIYLDDGAPATAARLYRTAADHLDKWNELRNALLDGSPE